ncbi:large ribosomal subunit protein mL43-like [Sycon ciliatum]|uniref:large ribosomal subunit protein mL43-like n=1 Tax=Sycon ciliatum TaxID=27933 RepID=UPI0020AE8EC8|eukprot:scpid97183/ scgid31453/ 39S ribosomal protein L43, mitochondrial; Mitochondrial ribosomal protein bMRP36a
MSEGLPHPRPLEPLHPVTKPKYTGTGAGSIRASRFGFANKPILPPKPTPIYQKGAVPIPILSNGVGRYTCLLLRLTLVRCSFRCSLGLDRWINNRLKKFSEENPNVAVYVKDAGEGNHFTRVYGNYSHGKSRLFDVNKDNEDEVDKKIHRLLYMNGLKEQTLWRYKHTVNPSVQGYWHPFMNKPWRKLTEVDTPNMKTEQELMQRRLIRPETIETEV